MECHSEKLNDNHELYSATGKKRKRFIKQAERAKKERLKKK
ncbi:hypothetical protein [Clostridium botulinum]|nr:hypothetical protein [Clostridium botulinum]